MQAHRFAIHTRLTEAYHYRNFCSTLIPLHTAIHWTVFAPEILPEGYHNWLFRKKATS